MSFLLFECTICSEDYNSTSKAPMNLPCGHTVCLSCLGKLLEEKNKRCPQCRVVFPKGKVKLGSFSRNYFALNAISDRDARVYGLCDIHSEPKIWACLTDRKKICQECYENAAHKKHKIEPADKIREQADQKKSKLESKLKDVENSIQQSFNLLKEEENVVSKLLQAQYDEGLMMMNKRQQQIKLLVKDFFGLKKTETENALEADLDKTKNSLEYKINMLTNPSSEEKFFHVLEEPEPEILIINKKQDELKKEVQALQQTIKTSYESCFKDVNHLMHTLYVKLQGKQQPPSLSLPSAHSSSALVITNQNAPQTDPPTIEISQITHINEFGSSTQEVYASKAQDIPKKIKNALNLHKLENASRIIIEFQPGLEDEDVNSFCKIVFGKMKTVTEIRSLKLKLSKTQITEKSAEILFDYLVNFKRLDRLRFCLKETAQGFVYALVNTLMKSLEFPGFKPTSVGIYSCLELDKETLGLIDKMKKNFPKTVYESEKCLFHLT